MFRLINPSNDPAAGARHWVATVGNLGTAELLSVAYDDLNHVILGGAQDNGSIEQFGTTWAQLMPRDGVGVQVDQTSIPGSSIHYYEGDFGSFFTRAVFNNAHLLTDQHLLDLIVERDRREEAPLRRRRYQSIHQPFELNTVDPRRMLIGTQYLYAVVRPRRPPGTADGRGQHRSGHRRGIRGPSGGAAHRGSCAYIGTSAPPGSSCAWKAGGPFRPLSAYPATSRSTWPWSPAIGVGLTSSTSNHIWATFNSGKASRNVTGDLRALTPSLNVAGGAPSLPDDGNPRPRSGLGGNTVIVGGFGGVYALRNPGASSPRPRWVKLGDGLPNVVVTDVHYDAKDDVVIAGTFGRGASILPHPRRFLRPTHRRAAMALSTAVDHKTLIRRRAVRTVRDLGEEVRRSRLKPGWGLPQGRPHPSAGEDLRPEKGVARWTARGQGGLGTGPGRHGTPAIASGGLPGGWALRPPPRRRWARGRHGSAPICSSTERRTLVDSEPPHALRP